MTYQGNQRLPYDMQYLKLCEVYEELEKNPSRLKKIEILSEFLKKLKEKDYEILYLIQGRVWPDYEEKEFGISTQLTIKALAKSSGKPESDIVKKWKKQRKRLYSKKWYVSSQRKSHNFY